MGFSVAAESGLPLAEADIRGVPRFNPDIAAHANGAAAEEQLAQTVQGLPNQQVVRWGDPIGSHGADVISVDTQTGDVTLWDSKYRSADVTIQESPTFAAGSNARANAIQQAIDTIDQNTSLSPSIRQQALDNLLNGQVKTRTVGFGNAKNSVFGN